MKWFDFFEYHHRHIFEGFTLHKESVRPAGWKVSPISVGYATG